MSVFMLSGDLVFPSARLAREDGLLCVGGDLTPQRLILAYENGIFPWYSENEPICWWSPDPRMVLFPSDMKISRSLKKKLRKAPFTITINQDFTSTILGCASSNSRQHTGTWITSEMMHAYIRLHEMGIAHSIEAWAEDRLVGGLYGICLGRCFFGESMFSLVSDASKAALAALARYLLYHNFDLIDCQVPSDHLMSLGAVLISRDLFLEILKTSRSLPLAADLWERGKQLSFF